MSRMILVLLSAFLLSACTTHRSEITMETPEGYSNPVPLSSIVASNVSLDSRSWEEKAEAIEKIAEQEAALQKSASMNPPTMAPVVDKTKRQAKLVKKMKRTAKQVARLAKKSPKRLHGHLALK